MESSIIRTPPSPPTAVYLRSAPGHLEESVKIGNYYYYKQGGVTRLYWPAGQNGSGNQIVKYRIYISVDGGDYYATSGYSSSKETLDDGKEYYFFDVKGEGGLERGHYQTYQIQSIGTYNNSDVSTATSPRLYKNRLPIAPIGNTKTAPSTAGKTSLSYTEGSDADGQSVTIYYSTTPTGEKSIYKENTNLDFGTYYLWSYDGLEFSSDYGTAVIRKDTAAPTISDFSYSSTDFTPYYTNSSYKYITSIKFTSITGTSGDYSTIKEYTFYYAESNNPATIPKTGKVMSSYPKALLDRYPPSFEISNYITAGNYFKIGIDITTSTGEASSIIWSTIFCCGKAITAEEFSPSFVVSSNIDNSRNDIDNADDIVNYFNNYIKLEWTNPSITANRFGILKIECGITNSAGTSFTSVITYTSTGISFIPSTVRNIKNTGYLYIGNTVSRGSTTIPAIRVTPINGASFIKSSKITKTRTKLLSFSGAYSVSPKPWLFFSNYDTNITFSGNKIFGDANFAVIKSAKIKNNQLTTSYNGVYTADESSSSSHISFSTTELNTFKTRLKALKKDSSVNSTYTITVTDRYDNSTSTTVEQVIDFRVTPSWGNAILTTSVHYLTSQVNEYTEINTTNITKINQRILNPNEVIQLSWGAAEDPGNGDNSTITYKVSCYTKEETTQLNYLGGTLAFETTTSNTYFNYTIPYGNTSVKSIYFKIEAIDQSGLYATNYLETSSAQVLGIGRAMPPDFDVITYKIDELGNLSGTFKINDYGDSRSDVNPDWTNYDRLGKLILITGKEENKKELSYDDSCHFSDTDYITFGKINLSFSLYPNHLEDQITTRTYIFNFDGPTFSYRNHQIGINILADNEESCALSIAGSQTSNKTKVKLVSLSAELPDIYIDLETNKITNLIIDCGEW